MLAVARLGGTVSHAEAIPTATPRRRTYARSEDDVRIYGVGNLLTNMARCCKPAPGDQIIGFITRGRGVTIHRRDCKNILNMGEEKRSRLIEVEWSTGKTQTYPVDIEVLAVDRTGLLRDITSILANEKVNVIAVNTRSDPLDHSASMRLTVEIDDVDQLSRVLNRIGQLSNVMEAKRYIQ